MSNSTPIAHRRMVISSLWLQVAILTFLAGFAALLYLAYRIHAEPPPIPERVVAEDGSTLFTGDDIMAGQHVFQKYGLMQYGTIFGHGAYLGPDFTAQYLHEAANAMVDFHRDQGRPRRRPESCRRTEAESFRSAVRRPPAFTAEPDLRLRRNLPSSTPTISARGGADRIATTGHYRSDRDPSIDGLLRLVGMGGGRHTARDHVFLHEQLAVRADGRQHADRRSDSLEHTEPDHAVGRNGLMLFVVGRWDLLGLASGR